MMRAVIVFLVAYLFICAFIIWTLTQPSPAAPLNEAPWKVSLAWFAL